MRFTIRWVAALAVPALLLLGSPEVGAQKKKVNKDADKDVTTEKMVRAGVLVGKVEAVYEDKRRIRLQVSVPKLNPQAMQNMVLARARGDIRGMILAKAQMYTMGTQPIELQAIDDVVVRTAKPREEFDEKGKVKKLTRAELKELKGPDPKLPGFNAEFGDVSTDQVIQVTLVKKKSAGAPAKPTRGKGKGKKDEDADAAVDLLSEHLPQISMIVILQDPPPTAR